MLLETSKGDLVIDLYTDECPVASSNFLKLCKCACSATCRAFPCCTGAFSPPSPLRPRLLPKPMATVFRRLHVKSCAYCASTLRRCHYSLDTRHRPAAARPAPALLRLKRAGACRRCKTHFSSSPPHALRRIKYYNNVLFHKVERNFIVQTGDPTGTGKGGSSINGCARAAPRETLRRCPQRSLQLA